jgi:hypothetical protein
MSEWLVLLVWIASLKVLQILLPRTFASRKILHVLVGLSVIPLVHWIHHWSIAAIPATLILAANAHANLQGVPARAWRRRAYSVFGFLIPLALLLYLWAKGRTGVIVLSVLVMSLGDAAAAWGGLALGKRRIPWTGKSLEGALCNLLVSFTILFAFTHAVLPSVLTSTAAASLEAVVPGAWDNPAVLMLVALLLIYFNTIQ